MIAFLFTGINMETLEEIVKRAIRASDGSEVLVFGSSEPVQCYCFNSETGEEYKDAHALAIYIDYIAKKLKDER